MKYGLLFRKTSTCYKHPDIEYLDETSDYRLRIKAKDLGLSFEELKQKDTYHHSLGKINIFSSHQ